MDIKNFIGKTVIGVYEASETGVCFFKFDDGTTLVCFIEEESEFSDEDEKNYISD